MSQLVLVKSNKIIDEFMPVNSEAGIFRDVIQKYFFGNSSCVYTFNIDGLMLNAQTEINLGINFESTKLYKLFKQLVLMSDEIILWYASDFEDLDLVINDQQLFNGLKESLKDSFCEAYLHYKPIERSLKK